MPKNISEVIGRFIVKYIWLLCIPLVFLECVSTVYCATVLMKRASSGVMSSITGEVSGRVDGTLKLITSLANHEYMSDTDKSTYERAVFARSFQEAYDLFMVAVTDEEGYVSSSDETEPPKDGEQFNLMFRDYMQRLYSTGTYQITDPIVAGSDNTTVNYTIAVPIIEDDKVMGSVFGAIYFDEIQSIISRDNDSYTRTYLFGRENTLITETSGSIYGTSLDRFWTDTIIAFGHDAEQMKSNMKKRVGGSFWALDSNGLEYVRYGNIAPTEWTLAYSTNFFTMLLPLLPVFLLKVAVYISMCFAISVISRRSLKRQLSSVNQLLNTMSSIHRRLFQNDSSDYTTMLEITCEGLLDQLTGLSTRTLFHNKISQWDFGTKNGAVIFVDLDDLKVINDSYGHEAGDAAIQLFGDVLKQFESKHNAIAARYGGDEFVIVVDLEQGDDVTAFCQRLNDDMSKEIEVNYTATPGAETSTARISVHASVGAALYPSHGSKAEDLICKADIALYEAKRQGKGRWVIYSDDII